MVDSTRNIKNSGNELTNLDSSQVLKTSYNDANKALDTVSVDSLVHERFYKVSCTYVTLGNDSEEIDTITYYGLGKNQVHEIDIASDPAGYGEITFVSFLGKTAVSLDGKYLIVYDSVGSVGIWFNLDGASTPPTTGADRDIDVTIATGDSPTTLANKLATELSLDPEFYSSNSTYTAAILNIVVGNRTNSLDGDSGLAITTNRDGVASINNKYFSFDTVESDAVYYVWANLDSTGSDPAPIIGAIGIEVPIVTGDSASAIATKYANAINSVSNLFVLCTTSGNTLILKYGKIGLITGITNGNTRHTFRLKVSGEDCPIVAKLFIEYGDNYEISKIERITVGENTN